MEARFPVVITFSIAVKPGSLGLLVLSIVGSLCSLVLVLLEFAAIPVGGQSFQFVLFSLSVMLLFFTLSTLHKLYSLPFLLAIVFMSGAVWYCILNQTTCICPGSSLRRCIRT
jgi:hypothetical protein